MKYIIGSKIILIHQLKGNICSWKLSILLGSILGRSNIHHLLMLKWAKGQERALIPPRVVTWLPFSAKFLLICFTFFAYHSFSFPFHQETNFKLWSKVLKDLLIFVRKTAHFLILHHLWCLILLLSNFKKNEVFKECGPNVVFKQCHGRKYGN